MSLILAFLLFSAVFAEPSNLKDNFGTKTPNPLTKTDWKAITDYAQLPETCSLIHFRAVLRHGTRSYGSDDVELVEAAIAKMKQADAQPVEASGGISSAQLNAIYAWQNQLNTNKDLLPRGIDENKFLAGDYYFGLFNNLTRDRNLEDATKVLWETSSVRRARESCTAFKAEWFDIVNSDSLQSTVVNDTRNYFHKHCQAYLDRVANNPEAAVEYEKSNSTNEAIKLLTKVNKIKLGFNSNVLSWDEIVALYNVAAVEVAAWDVPSVLLPLFDDEDLAYLEYSSDLEAYWLKSYSVDPIARDISCVLTNHIFETAEAAFKDGAEKSPSMFTFTHNEILMPIFGAFGLFYDEAEGYKANASRYFYTNRHYDTSSLGKFASNFVFLFFHCSGETKPRDKMVLLLVNGQPMAMPDACPFELACPYENVKSGYPYATGFPQQCDYNELCRPSEKSKAWSMYSSHPFMHCLLFLLISLLPSLWLF